MKRSVGKVKDLRSIPVVCELRRKEVNIEQVITDCTLMLNLNQGT